MKKLIALLLAVLMLVGMLGACSSETKTEDTSTDTETKTEDKKEETKKEEDKKEESSDEGEDAATEGKRVIELSDGTKYTFNETGFPITDEPSTFEVVVASTLTTFDNMINAQNFAADTNVYPEYTLAASGSEKKNLILASGDYPDAMQNMVSATDCTQYGPQGIFIPLNDLMDKYVTNFHKFLDPEQWAQMTSPDGNIYHFPVVCASRAGSDDAMGYGDYHVNKLWLENLGLEHPTTVDEWYDVLVAFRDNDPNGNGQKDEIPLGISLWYTPLEICGTYFGWFGQVGVPYLDDGKVIDPRTSEEYKEGIKFLQKLYAEGLVEQELFTQDYTTFRAKATGGDVSTYGYMFTYSAGYTVGTDRAIAEYERMPMLYDQNGEQRYVYSDDNLATVAPRLVIMEGCEVPEIIARWVDYLYDPLVSMAIQNGPLGVMMEIEDDGTLVVWKDNTHPENIPEGYDTYMNWRNAESFIQFPRLLEIPKVQEYMIAEYNYDPLDPSLSHEREDFFKGRAMYDPIMVPVKPNPNATVEEAEELNILNTDLDKCFTETMTRFITTNADIDAEWDAYVDQIMSYGFEDRVAIWQQQTDRYLASMQ